MWDFSRYRLLLLIWSFPAILAGAGSVSAAGDGLPALETTSSPANLFDPKRTALTHIERPLHGPQEGVEAMAGESEGQGEDSDSIEELKSLANSAHAPHHTTLTANESSELNYFVPSKSVGTKRETEPPGYVGSLHDLQLFSKMEEDWIEFGADYRLRYENRENDIRQPVAIRDEPLLTRTRVYLGIKNKLDPFRGAIEFEDARVSNSHFPADNRDVNEAEIIQAYGELYFDDGLGPDRPVRLQAGRLAFEYVDRRLIARNNWRNTTNNFQGIRAILGQQKNDWQLDLLAVQPVERLPTELDRVDEEVWFFGVIGDWRRWSEIVTFQPYYLLLDQNGKGERINRELHTLGLRGYGNIAETPYDYDAQIIVQFGKNDGEQHRAWAVTSELGYTFEHPWKPRWSGFFGYASGDRDPGDNTNERFDKLFGFARPWSSSDYITFDNVIAPKTRITFQPHPKVRMEVGYNAYWLASRTDLWANARLRDPTGESGNFMGHELDMSARFPLGEHTDFTIGYAHFTPGAFPRSTGKPKATDFFYIELSPSLLN